MHHLRQPRAGKCHSVGCFKLLHGTAPNRHSHVTLKQAAEASCDVFAHSVKDLRSNGSLLGSLCLIQQQTQRTEGGDPHTSAITHPPHGYVVNLRRDQAPEQQRAAPMPGVCQAAVCLHPAPTVSSQFMFAKEGLGLLGTRVVPGPHCLLLKKEK